ncbi:MAG: hypothetical protein DRJ05_02150, partial [Bacteroidetes bacterium]
MFFAVTAYWSVAQNCSVNAGVDETICDGEQMFLHATKTGLYTGNHEWTQVSGPSVTIVNPHLFDTEIINFSGGNTYTFRFSETCQDGYLVYQDVDVVVLDNNPADAGPDATYCPADMAFLAANPPGAGETGDWETIGGNQAGVDILNPNSNTSQLTFVDTRCGTATLIWRILNSNGCTSYDTVLITNRGGEQPIDAGLDQILDHCFSTTHVTDLGASFGGCGIDGQEGTWTVISGPNMPVFDNEHSATATITNLIEGTYVLQWTVDGVCVSGSDQMTITVPPPTADLTVAEVIGGNQVFCDARTSTVLEGSPPLYVDETVEWTQIIGPAATIVSPNSPITSVTGLDGSSTYVFLYTITNSVTNCTSAEQVTVSYFNDAPGINIIEDHIFADCGETWVEVAYTFFGSGTNQYSIISGPPTDGITYPTDWVNAGASPTLITGLDSIGTYTIQFRRYTSVNVSCATAYDVVDVTISLEPTASNAGTFQILACQITITNLVGNAPSIGTGTWSQVSGPTLVTLTNIHNPVVAISDLSNGFYTFQWLIAAGPQCDPKSDKVTILVANILPEPADAGDDQLVCYGTPVYMDADAPQFLFEYGTWSVVPDVGVVFTDTHDPKTEVSGLVDNTVYTFTWTITNGCGSNSDDVIITVNNDQGPIASDAGTDQCWPSGTNIITLDGNDPDPGSGLWTKLSGPSATITYDTAFNTTVTALTDGTYAFEWAISSGGCTPTRDTVLITIADPIIADAGNDLEICGDSTRLVGNDPSPGTGLWTQISGNAGDTIRTPSNNITDLINLQSGTYKFTWTITNGACVTIDTVSVFVTYPPGSIADAGPDIVVCNDNSATMAAVDPAVGTGLWTILSGPNTPDIVDPSLNTTAVNNLVTGDYKFLWTVSSGGFCMPSIDTVEISVTLEADAGADQNHCNAVTTVNLVGTTSGVGIWSQLGTTPNVATVTTTSPNTATASGLITGDYTFVFQVDTIGGVCYSSDTMTVSLYDPASLADAGPDQEHCNVTVFTMAGNTPATGTGTWTKLFGPAGGSFTDANDPTTTFTNPDYGVYVFEWTVANDECSNTDQVRITNYEEPTDADAGPDQDEVCGTVATLAANTPTAGIGVWSIDTASIPTGTMPVIDAPIQPLTTISNMIPDTYPGVYTFVWTISNGVCTDKTDTVVLTVYENPTMPDAGPDQELCDQTSTNLSGNTITTGTGTWTVYSKPPAAVDPTIVSPNDPLSNVTGLVYGDYVFEWTAVNTLCSYSDTVRIINDQAPTLADASATATELCLYDQFTLDGNTPTVGTGFWTQVSGSTVTILNPTNPQTDVVGAVAGVYGFAWTISNGVCPPSIDNITVTVYDIPSQAIAGPDQELCDVTTTALEGNDPDAGSTGTWTFYSGPNNVTFDNANDPTTNVNGLVPASSAVYELVWSHSVGICAKSDTMQITVWDSPSPANAGSNQTLCNETTVTMAATNPGVGTGEWSQVSGPNTPTITDPSSNTTTITGIIPGDYTFLYTVTNGSVCPPSTDEVDIHNYDTFAVSGSGDQEICKDGSTDLTVVPDGGSGSYTYQWQEAASCAGPWTDVTTGSGGTTDTYSTPNLAIGNYYYHCVVSDVGGVCTPVISDCGTITVVDDPEFTSQSGNDTVCRGGNTDFSVIVQGGTGFFTYQWQRSTNSCSGPWTNIGTNSKDYNTGNMGTVGSYYYQCIITQSGLGCDVLASNCMELEVLPDAIIATQPIEATICSGTTWTMSVTAAGGSGHFGYRWQISTTGTGGWSTVQNSASNTYTTAALTSTRYYRVRVIDSVAGCRNPLSDVAPVYVPEITAQPVGTTMCDGGQHTMTVDVEQGDATLNYQWQRSDVPSPYTWTNVGTDSDSYTTDPLLTGTYYFQCVISVTNPTCSDLITDVATVVAVNDPVVATNPIGDTICINDTHTMDVTASGGTGTFDYQWRISSDNIAFSDISNATNSTYTTEQLTQDRYYYCVVEQTGVACNTFETDTALVAVNNISPGTIQADEIICYNTSTAELITGIAPIPDGNLSYRWEISTTSAISGFSPLGVTTENYQPGNLIQDTWYRRVAISTLSVYVCEANSNAVKITVNPIPTVDPINNVVYCNGSATAIINFIGSVTGTVFDWTNDNTSIGLAANGTGVTSILSFTATNSGNTVQMANISVTPRTENGLTCIGTPTTFTITINPTPTVATVSDQELCNDATTNAIVFTGDGTGTVTGTIYNWTNSAPSIGIAASGIGDIASFTAINTGASPVMATLEVTPSYTNGGITCDGTPESFTITVNPTPTVSSASTKTICDNAFVDYIITSATTGATFEWTASMTSTPTGGTITGITASGTGVIINDQLDNTGTSPGKVTYTITPTGPDTTYCPGTPFDFVVTVQPTPDVIASGETICDEGTTDIDLTTNITGETVTYKWTAANTSGGTITGFSNCISSCGTTIAQTLYNNTSQPGTVTYTLTPSIGTCDGVLVNVDVVVNPTGQVDDPADQVVCNTDNTTLVTFTTTNTGGTTTYAWTNDDTSIGLAASGSGDIAAFAAVNTGTSP